MRRTNGAISRIAPKSRHDIKNRATWGSTTCRRIKQDLAEPDPIRLAYRDVIKQTIHAVVTHPDDEALQVITHAVAARVPEPDRAAVQSLLVDELRRLHEGVLARYSFGLQSSPHGVRMLKADS